MSDKEVKSLTSYYDFLAQLKTAIENKKKIQLSQKVAKEILRDISGSINRQIQKLDAILIGL